MGIFVLVGVLTIPPFVGAITGMIANATLRKRRAGALCGLDIGGAFVGMVLGVGFAKLISHFWGGTARLACEFGVPVLFCLCGAIMTTVLVGRRLQQRQSSWAVTPERLQSPFTEHPYTQWSATRHKVNL